MIAPPSPTVTAFVIALGFGDDIDGPTRLWTTWSLSEASCLDAAREQHPQAVFIGYDVPVKRGERL